MESTPISFDQLPNAVADLNRKVDYLTTLFNAHTRLSTSLPDRWLSIVELSEFLPGRPAVSTLYGKVQRREIPFKRMGKRLVFLQSEIDQWLKSQHRRTQAETIKAAEQYVSAIRKGRK